jgi:alpha-N-acetylglucosamine transferase
MQIVGMVTTIVVNMLVVMHLGYQQKIYSKNLFIEIS